MGKYTRYGSTAFDQRVDTDLKTIVEAVTAMPEAGKFLSIVLMGGYGRQEGTPYRQNGIEVPYNDYDLVVVGKKMTRFRHKKVQAALLKQEKTLSDKIGLTVDLFLHTTGTLKKAEFSLMNYEMKYGHMVVWGQQDILDIMPDYHLNNLDLSEGTRLLLNRGKLLLDIKMGLERYGFFSQEEFERYVKFILKAKLALGDCALMITNRYDVSYIKKRQAIRDFAAEYPEQHWLVEAYLEAIDAKESGDLRAYEHIDLKDEFEEINEHYQKFILWYEGRRLHKPLKNSEDYLEALESCKDNESMLKCLLLNLLIFKKSAISPGYGWLLHHPRQRLYGALSLLLQDKCDGISRSNLTKLLGNSSSPLSNFYQLRGRLS